MELIQYLEVFDGLVDVFKRVSPYFFRPDIFQNHFGLLWICPEISLLGDQLFILYFNCLTIVVKDTSSRRSRGPSSLSTCLMSWIFIFKVCANIVIPGKPACATKEAD
jgi:hypothetical protein